PPWRLFRARLGGFKADSAHFPALPDDPADNVDAGQIDFAPGRPGGIVAADRDRAGRRIDRAALHDQRAVRAQHVDAVAQPIGAVTAIDEDVVAVGKRRRHRIAGDTDDRELVDRA